MHLEKLENRLREVDLCMKISIIIPYYNAREYIEDCLNSVLKQSLTDIEILIVDDGSTREDTNYLLRIINNNCKIRYFRQANMNAAVARNKAIDLAQGEYIYFLDSDDYLFDNKVLENAYNDIQGYELLVGNYTEFDSNGNIYPYKVSEDFVYSINSPIRFAHLSPPPSNKLFSRKVIVNNDIYFSNVRIGQDLNFFF